ncbi:uncharacterized protein VICG_00183 [Vittaforma corneae ATCC 50505]|uniref:Uncharacterized protein n=1 Tax=Vittaforma corneae (strain ATCC 50505) TaxID=993615 RepID=L2GPP9_VITCO|nr:uncharacterized protein VICG_00183 [Vittaforma corneae ATCC 50505]ELA42868.1 hypothetical protein VICG_00183 [Vittaforma corneae ATCC 50505]
MKRSLVARMKIVDPKRLRAAKIVPQLRVCIKKTSQPQPYRFVSPTVGVVSEVLKSINVDDGELKLALIDLALTRFIANKTPINISFTRFLKNFDKFNVFSLLCACSYMESARIASKGDVRTFIYIFLGFNILSSKYLDDYCVWNSAYTSLWGIDYIQASQIELFALKRLNYKLAVNISSILKMLSEAFDILEM